MELSGRGEHLLDMGMRVGLGSNSLTLSTWLDDDQLHGLPLMEGDSDLFNSSMVSSAPILDHDDVNALFPMLSDSSFEYEGDQQLGVGDDPELPPFESDLSPIFAAKTMPLMAHRHETVSNSGKPKQQTTAAVSKVTVLTPRSKRKLDNTANGTTTATERPTSASRKQRKALTPVNKPVMKTPEPQIIYSNNNNDSFLTPVRSEQDVSKSSNNTGATAKRRRSASKNELPGLSTTWSEQEQSAFFSTFKNKWPVDERSLDESSSTITTIRSPSFSTMLLQRFDAISKKIKTKTMIEVRLFYTTVLSNISGLLKELDNDIDLTNPDEVRIAVWCWSKLLTDESHKKDFQNVATADPSVKKRLSHVLLQSIIRSRRQMLKAKSSAGYLYNSAPSVITHSKQQQSIGRQSSGVVTSQSSVFSALTNLSARSAAASSSSANSAAPGATAAVIHHPMVRKKARAAFATSSSSLQTLVPNPVVLAEQQQSQQSQQTQQFSSVVSEVVTGKSTLKRKRAESTEAAVVVVDETPLKTKRQQLVHMEASFVSPAPTMSFSQQSQQQHQSQKQRDSHHVTSQTPPQSSRKKISIKMRIVPMDKATKAHVVSTGCNPKVELKLTSTKRISEVAQHMAKKWEKARALVPADAMLQFYEKQEDGDVGDDNGEAVGWSEKDRSVTCFDIWKRCGKKIKNENVVVVYYAWKSGGASGAGGLRKMSGSDRSEAESELDDLARSPGSLFAEEISLADLGENAVIARSLSSSSASLARGLQQFGESMAFHSSEFSDAALEKDVVQVEKQKLKKQACPLDALLDENDDEEETGEPAFVDCSPNTQQQRLRRRITPMLVAKEEFDL